ncbi:Golgi to er traffic protein 4 homolog [Plakobranchus ocellatus]|uniref:Golgi to er traffic protein 4 homolog n=1 Tax=Plakobranchus ocellatus TaxID=259542 RepID=A0AAV4AIZ0_9GAST|nr:Golgi to er traffic protein 4 homolog [Plakobranchus ocellatus]
MAATSRGVDRVLAKCEACINAGNYYEAHQMFRTVYFRYNGQQKFTEAADLLYRGALILLRHNQHSSGADLSLLFIDVLTKSKSTVTDTIIGQISTLFERMDPECPERYPFLTKAINWSSKVNKNHKRGHPDLHQRFGVIFKQEQNYPQARYHYIHSCDGEGCAQLLVEFHTSHGYSSEVDMFITQAVLQYLCLQNKTTASLCFELYTQKHPAIDKGPPFGLPLLNFIWLLLIALEGGKLAVFTVLCEKYQVSINRDPNYKEYLDQIGQLFFGVPPPQRTPQGLFGNLLQNVLVDVDSDEEDNMGSSSTSHLQGNRMGSGMPNLLTNSSACSSSSTRQVKPESNFDVD